jgi:hypothetical protein
VIGVVNWSCLTSCVIYKYIVLPTAVVQLLLSTMSAVGGDTTKGLLLPFFDGFHHNGKREYSSIENAQNPKAKSRSAGHDSILKPIEQYLLRYIFELREQGIGVKIDMVMRRAASVSRVFRDKSPCAQYNAARRFTRSHGLVYRMSTHESQRDPAVVAAESLDFILSVRPKLIQPCRHHDYILNMDQTPILFAYHSNRTLEISGIRKSHADVCGEFPTTVRFESAGAHCFDFISDRCHMMSQQQRHYLNKS